MQTITQKLIKHTLGWLQEIEWSNDEHMYIRNTFTCTYLFIKSSNFHMIFRHRLAVSIVLACSEGMVRGKLGDYTGQKDMKGSYRK